MNKKTLYSFIISFILLLTVVVLNRLTFDRMKNYAFLVEHTREVITTFESISDDFKGAQIYTPSYDSSSFQYFYKLYKQDADSIPAELLILQHLVKDNLEQ